MEAPSAMTQTSIYTDGTLYFEASAFTEEAIGDGIKNVVRHYLFAYRPDGTKIPLWARRRNATRRRGR